MEVNRNEKMGKAIDKASRQLPNGYKVRIEVELESIDVFLEGPEWDDIDYPSNCESPEQEVRDAVEHAILLETGES